MHIINTYYARIPLTLLEQVANTEKGTVSFYYKHFEDAYWKEVIRNPEEAIIRCGKDGGREFPDFLHAALTMFDVMKLHEGISVLNDDATN